MNLELCIAPDAFPNTNRFVADKVQLQFSVSVVNVRKKERIKRNC